MDGHIPGLHITLRGSPVVADYVGDLAEWRVDLLACTRTLPFYKHYRTRAHFLIFATLYTFSDDTLFYPADSLILITPISRLSINTKKTFPLRFLFLRSHPLAMGRTLRDIVAGIALLSVVATEGKPVSSGSHELMIRQAPATNLPSGWNYVGCYT